MNGREGNSPHAPTIYEAFLEIAMAQRDYGDDNQARQGRGYDDERYGYRNDGSERGQSGDMRSHGYSDREHAQHHGGQGYGGQGGYGGQERQGPQGGGYGTSQYGGYGGGQYGGSHYGGFGRGQHNDYRGDN